MRFKQSTLYLIAFVFLMISISFSSAYLSEWTQWRGSVTSYGAGLNSLGLGGINSSTPMVNYSAGQSLDSNSYWVEPLALSINEPNTYANYLVFPNGNYLQVYDGNLNLQTETALSGKVLGQLSQIQNTSVVYGILRNNLTSIAFTKFNFNVTSQNFDVVQQVNYTHDTIVNSTGIRCLATGGASCFAFLSSYNATSTNYTIYLAKLNSGSLSVSRLGESRVEITSIPTGADWDNDGVFEILGYTTNDVFVANAVTLALEKYYHSGKYDATNYNQIRYGAFSKVDSSPFWKLILIQDGGSETGYGLKVTQNQFCQVVALRNDLSTLWSSYTYQKTWGSATSGLNVCGNFVLFDYDGDNLEDIIAVSASSYPFSNDFAISLIKGTTGNRIKSFNASIGDLVSYSFPYGLSITAGRIHNSTGFYDLLITGGQQSSPPNDLGRAITTFSLNHNRSFSSYTITGGTTSNKRACIIADVRYDGYNDIICTREGHTYILGAEVGTFANSNPTITSLTFNPSTTIALNTPLTITINANDAEGDSKLYYSDCGNGFTSTESSNSVQSCTYTIAGVYNFTAYVRDSFHVTYNSFSTSVTATTSSLSCNVNYVCESGETYANCPTDCPLSLNETTSQGSAGGSITIPTELVNVDDETQGILPQVYFGVLAFLSNSIAPVFIVVFVIFIVLTLLAIAGIIRKIAHKVATSK